MLKKLLGISYILLCSTSAIALSFTTSSIPVSGGPHGISGGDLNNDGAIDIITSNLFSDQIAVIKGNKSGVPLAADGTFSTPSFMATQPDPLTVIADYLDGDAFSDLIAPSNTSVGEVSVLMGDGSGVYSTVNTYSTTGGTSGTNGRFVASGQFNSSDSHVDLAVVNYSTNNVSILLGDGLGGFLAPNVVPLPPTSTNPVSVVVAKLNSDSYVDLAICNFNSSNVSILFGSASGSFTALANNIPVGQFPRSLVSGDFDKDNRIDLAVANLGSNSISIILNSASGFLPPTTISSVTSPSFIIAAKFDPDEFVDLAVTNSSTDKISVLLGKENGDFASPILFPVGDDPYSLWSGDFNADNHPDIAVANKGSNSVSILLNTTTFPFPASTTNVKKTEKIEFIISPNPAKDFVSITLPVNESKIESNATIEIANDSGKIVYKTNQVEKINSLDVSQYPRGLYYVRVINKNKSGSGKLILQ